MLKRKRGIRRMAELVKVEETVREMARLLDEAYRHYFANSDGHCKSVEGAISLHFGNHFDREHYDKDALEVSGVEVYSYVLGPSRTHWFKGLNEALHAVRQWHKEEMEFDYESENGKQAT
jgi:hypothetical protein